jgi:hypothetical protein
MTKEQNDYYLERPQEIEELIDLPSELNWIKLSIDQRKSVKFSLLLPVRKLKLSGFNPLFNLTAKQAVYFTRLR